MTKHEKKKLIKYRSRHCLAILPCTCDAIIVHLAGPCFITRFASWTSSWIYLFILFVCARGIVCWDQLKKICKHKRCECTCFVQAPFLRVGSSTEVHRWEHCARVLPGICFAICGQSISLPAYCFTSLLRWSFSRLVHFWLVLAFRFSYIANLCSSFKSHEKLAHVNISSVRIRGHLVENLI